MDNNIVYRGEYDDIPFLVMFEAPFHYTVIAAGQEICSSTSQNKAREKFKALIDTGLKLD